MKNKKVFTITVDRTTYDSLTDYSILTMIPKARIVNKAIIEYLKKQKIKENDKNEN